MLASGICGSLHDWLSSFLHDRSQSVSVGGQLSAPLPVRSGVPQGSVLGPTLFLLFLRDMGDSVKNSLDFYADDSTLHLIVECLAARSAAASINADPTLSLCSSGQTLGVQSLMLLKRKQ